jgi:release factor glutamine methyltransferase
VLVPRPETESLVERALQLAGPRGNAVDLGTGSGAIAIAFASERPQWQVTATDLSPAALAIATRNAQRLLPGRLRLLQGSWFEPLAGQRFSLVMSNPPYIDAADTALADPALRHEPSVALTPGPDGLAALRAIITAAPAHLLAEGVLLLEHGAAQGAAVRALLEARGFRHVVSRHDLAGHERVSEGHWPAN